jgi:vanillate O-demethylase ferredoxin subunit
MNALIKNAEGISMRTAWIEVIVKSKRMEAEGIASFELTTLTGQALPEFSPGAHIDVEVKPGLIRQYSLCGVLNREDSYLIGVLNDVNSRGGSKFLHTVQEGQVLRISHPRNHFPLTHNAKHSILMAGGIGITPILSMAEKLFAMGQSFELHFSARSREKAAFQLRIIESGLKAKTSFYFDEENQRVDLDNLLQKPERDTHLYVCGPQGFMTAVLNTATEYGWPDDQLHKEFFVAAPQETVIENKPFDIMISSTGERFHIAEDESILSVLERQGIEIPVSCEQGICGTCLTGVLEGEVDHRDSLLTMAEKAKNDIFTPCCSRAKGQLLVLDL